MRPGSSPEKPGPRADPVTIPGKWGRLLHTVPSSRVLEGFEECCPCPYVPLFLLIAAGLQKNPLSPKRSGRCPERGQAGRGLWECALGPSHGPANLSEQREARLGAGSWVLLTHSLFSVSLTFLWSRIDFLERSTRSIHLVVLSFLSRSSSKN